MKNNPRSRKLSQKPLRKAVCLQQKYRIPRFPTASLNTSSPLPFKLCGIRAVYCLDHLRHEVRGGWFRSTPMAKCIYKNAVRGFVVSRLKISSTCVAILFVGICGSTQNFRYFSVFTLLYFKLWTNSSSFRVSIHHPLGVYLAPRLEGAGIQMGPL